MSTEAMGVRDAAACYASQAEQEVPAGYKRTEVGIIPEDWDVKHLGELAAFKSGTGFPIKYQGLLEGKYPFFKVSDLGRPGNERFMYNAQHYISEDVRKHLSATLFPEQAIVFAKIGAAIFLERKRILSQPSCLDNNLAALIVSSPDVEPLYLFYWFTTVHLGELVSTTALPSLAGSTVTNLVLPRPSVKEQCAIATALSDVDALITALDKLIAKKRAIKTAAMQQLLTGKTRLPGFSGAWETKRLGELGVFLKGSNVNREEAQSGSIPCVRYGELYTVHNDVIRTFSSWISREVAEKAVKIRKGDVLFVGSGETKEEIGKCASFLDDFEAYAGGDIVILRPTNDIDSVYLGYALNAPGIARQKAARGQGDAVVHISARALSGIVLELPPVEEQTAIAQVLSDMDAEIAALEARRDKTRVIKQGMMQQLLTGRVRLVNPGQQAAG